MHDETEAPAVAENNSATDVINSEETKRKKIRVRSKSRKSSSNLNLAEQLNGMKNLPVDIDPPAPVDLSVATESVTDTTGNPNVTQNIEEPENGSKRKKKKVRSRKIKPDDESTILVEPNSEMNETPVENVPVENPGNDDDVTIAEIPNVIEQNNEEDEKTVKKRRKVRSRKSKPAELEGNQGLEILPVPVINNEDTGNQALNPVDDLEKIENENIFPDKNVEIPIESDIPDSEFKNDDESAGNLADNESEEVVKKRKKKKVRSKKSATREPEGDQPLEGFKIYHLNYV